MPRTYNRLNDEDYLRALPKSGEYLSTQQISRRLGVNGATVLSRYQLLIELGLVEKVQINQKQVGYRRCLPT